MKRAILGCLVLVLALSGVSLAAPAQAATGSATGSATITGIDGVLYDDCVAHPYGYAVVPPDGAVYWALDLVLLGPDGRQAATGRVARPEPSGAGSFTLCPPANLYGGYTIRATLVWGAAEETIDQSSPLADAHFTLRRPDTRTALSVSTRRPARGQLVAYRIATTDERPEGYVATPFTWVHLEQRVDGRWVRIRGGRAVTHSTGRVTVRLRHRHHHQRMRVRAVTEPTTRYSRSASPVVRIW